MKVKKSSIPSGSLTENYLPTDYSDVYALKTDTGKEIIPDDIMISFWTDFPCWINALFKLRNILVKFVGLKGAENDNVKDYLSIHVESKEEQKIISAITLVNFNNKLGRIYFFVIRPFHGAIVKNMLKRAFNKVVGPGDD